VTGQSNIPVSVLTKFNNSTLVGKAIFARSVSASLKGGTGGVPDSSFQAGTQYVISDCAPGSAGCSVANSLVEISGGLANATQGGVPVGTTQMAANGVPVLETAKGISQGSLPGLTDSYVGFYSDGSLSFLVTAAGSATTLPTISPANGSATTGAYFGGNATPGSDMDTLKNTNVTATYTGIFVGFAGTPDQVTSFSQAVSGQNTTDVKGDTQLTANFGAGSVGGNVFNMSNYDAAGNRIGATDYGLRLDGTITGSTYSGTAQYTAASTVTGVAASAGSPTGQMMGGFFGPNAAETAGVVSIVGTVPGTGVGTSANGTAGADGFLVGGFGAKK
jgi:hypothetical protein